MGDNKIKEQRYYLRIKMVYLVDKQRYYDIINNCVPKLNLNCFFQIFFIKELL